MAPDAPFTAPPDVFTHPFEPDLLRRFTLRQALGRRLLARPEWLFRPLRAVWPRFSLGGALFILRYDHVQEVLARHDVFAAPYGPRITQVDSAGRNFILGMDDDNPAYRSGLAQVMQAMRLADLDRVGRLARTWTDAALSRADERFDVVGGLFTPVTTRIVDAYFGVPADPAPLALWAEALSNWIFATVGEDRTAERVAVGAGERLGRTVDAAIAAAVARTNRPLAPDEETLADRLVRNVSGAIDLPATQDAIRPVLDGLITAFVPNCTIAATNILTVLLDRPDIMARCRAAAATADDAAFGRHLMEAFRFRPLFPGPRRRCVRAHTLAADSPWAVTIRPGRIVIPCTQSAMMDGRRVTRPRRFDPDRPASHLMQFGFGLHGCAGAAVATTQLVNTFRPLLRGRPIRRLRGKDGRPACFGAFPERMHIRFAN